MNQLFEIRKQRDNKYFYRDKFFFVKYKFVKLVVVSKRLTIDDVSKILFCDFDIFKKLLVAQTLVHFSINKLLVTFFILKLSII